MLHQDAATLLMVWRFLVRRLRSISLFFVVNILFSLAANFVHPVTPTFFKELGFADYLFGYALAAMMTFNFLLSPFWGKLNGIISCRISLLISCWGYAAGQVVFALATTEAHILLARSIAGVFAGGCFVASLNYILNTAPDEGSRGVRLAAFATIQSVGGAFGYFIGGLLGAVVVKYAFVAQISTLVVCGLLFLVVCENDVKEVSGKLQTSQLIKEINPFKAFTDSRKFMSLSLALVFAVCTLHSLGQVAFDQSFNYYLKDQFNFSSAYNGALKAAMGIITLIANSTVCVYLLHRTDVRRSNILLLGVCSFTMLIIIFLEAITPFLIINVLFYAFAAIGIPLLQYIVADHQGPGDSNLMMGFYNAMRSFGGIIGATASGALYMLSPKYPFVCSAIAFLLAMILAVAYYRVYSLHDVHDKL